MLHLSSVPFEQIGYITGLPKTPMPDLTHRWLRVTAPVFAVLYAVFGALNWIVRRRMRRQGQRGRAHMNWRIRLTWWDKSLLAIMAVAAVIAFVRFATGIGTDRQYQQRLPVGLVGRLRDHDDDRHRRRRLHDHGVSRDLRRASLPLVSSSRRAHGFPLLHERDYHAHGGAWPSVDGLDGPGFLGADLRVVRSRLVRVFVSHGARLGVRAGAARAGSAGSARCASCARFIFRSCSSA